MTCLSCYLCGFILKDPNNPCPASYCCAIDFGDTSAGNDCGYYSQVTDPNSTEFHFMRNDELHSIIDTQLRYRVKVAAYRLGRTAVAVCFEPEVDAE